MNEQFQAGNLTAALAIERQLLALYVDAGRAEKEADASQVIGVLCAMLGEHEGAASAYARAAQLREALGDLRGTAVAWGRLGELRQGLGDHPGALEAFDAALTHLRRSGDFVDIGIVLNNQSISHRALGQPQEALRCLARALEIRRDFDDFEGLAASLHNLGVLHSDAGAHDEARRALEQARDIRSSRTDGSGLAATELHLGILHESVDEPGEATACYKRSLELARDPRAPNLHDQAAALCHLGGLLVAQGSAAQALPLLEEAQAVLAGVGIPLCLALVKFNQSLAWAALDQPQKGLESLMSAQEIQRRYRDWHGLSATLAAIGVVHARRGAHAAARTSLEEALQLQIQLGERTAQASTLRLLGQLSELQGQPEQAAREAASAAALLRLPSSVAGADASAFESPGDWSRVNVQVPDAARRRLQ